MQLDPTKSFFSWDRVSLCLLDDLEPESVPHLCPLHLSSGIKGILPQYPADFVISEDQRTPEHDGETYKLTGMSPQLRDPAGHIPGQVSSCVMMKSPGPWLALDSVPSKVGIAN